MDELVKEAYRALKDKRLQRVRMLFLVICPDKWRAKLLQAENSIGEEKIIYLPVAPRAGIPPIKTDYLREKYNIPILQL